MLQALQAISFSSNASTDLCNERRKPSPSITAAQLAKIGFA